jgi:transcriptional regulator with XRE-family HTH domain
MGYRIEDFNKERTLDELAEKVGCSRIYLQEVKAGKKHPSHKWLQAFAEYAGVTIPELYDEYIDKQEQSYGMVCCAVAKAEEYLQIKSLRATSEQKGEFVMLILKVMQDQNGISIADMVMGMLAEKAGIK